MAIDSNITTLNYVTSAFMGVIGITLFAAPDFFWNPAYGVLPLKFSRSSSPDAGQFDEVTLCGLRASGSVMFGMCLLAPLLMTREEVQSKDFLRTKFTLFAFHTLAFAIFALDSDPEMVPLFFGIMAVVKGYLAFLLFRAMQDKSVPGAPKSKEPKHSRQLFYVCVPWMLPWALLFVFSPNEISPAGRVPFFLEDVVEGQTKQGFTAVQKFAVRFEGVHLLACLAVVYNWVMNQIQLGWWCMVPPVLYTWVFMSALQDQTGYVDIPKQRLFLRRIWYTWFILPTRCRRTLPPQTPLLSRARPSRKKKR